MTQQLVLGVKVTLKSYVRKDDYDEDGEEISIVRGACIANNSGGSMISERLAESLGLVRNDVPIQVTNNPFADGPPFDVYTTKNGPLRVENDVFPGWFVLVDPVIVPSLFWDIILGGPTIHQPQLMDSTSKNTFATEGPGFVPPGNYIGHNIQYVSTQDKDKMYMRTSIVQLKFCGVSRVGFGGMSGGACSVSQYNPLISGREPLWFDSTLYSYGDAMGTEAAYLALHLGLKYCRDLADTSICICSDNTTVMKQLRGEEAVPRGTKLQVLHKVAMALIQQVTGARNRISFCSIPSTDNTGMRHVANHAIDAKLGVNEHGKELNDDFDIANMDPEEALARSVLGAFGSDPTLLSLQEMKNGWGSCLNFMRSYGLKPWKSEDVEEALAISRAMKEQDADDGDGPDVVAAAVDAENDAVMPPLEHLEPLRDASDEADMPPLEPLDDVPLSLRSLR